MDQDQIARIAEHLAENSPLLGVHLKAEQDQGRSQFIAAGRAKALTGRLEYAQTSTGKRFFDDSGVAEDGKHIHKTSYCDGRRCANVTYSEADVPQLVQISSVFMNETAYNARSIPFPVRSYYVGPIPLLDALPTAEMMPDIIVAGRPCDVLHFQAIGAVRKEDFVVALDKATSVPLRQAGFLSPEDFRTSRPTWVWEAVTFDATAAHPFVQDSTLTRYITAAGNGPTEADIGRANMTTRIHVLSYDMDDPMPDSVFWYKPQPGLAVIDTLAPRSARKVEATTATPTPPAGEAIRVEVPAAVPWSAIAVTSAVIAAAIALLAVRRGRGG